MRHIGKKIMILVLLISAAVAGVLVYYPTIVAPPKDVPVENTHEPYINRNINSISYYRQIQENDSLYNLLVDMIDLYQKEEFIGDDLADDKRYELMRKYVDVFSEWCDYKFCGSVWFDSDHEYMLDRISLLGQLLSNEGFYFAESHMNTFETIQNTIEAYRDARKIAATDVFVSVDSSTYIINKAYEYKQMSPLDNCDSLMNALTEVKTNLGNLHHDYVEDKLDRLAQYRQLNLSRREFLSRADDTSSDISDFINNVSLYGDDNYNSNEFTDRYRAIIDEAGNYYCNIDLCNSWESMESPDYSYRAYRSFSNYKKDGQYSMMKFTIRGYKNFTFYVRSYGESEHDFVVVGKDYRPSRNNNDVSTKNRSTSSSYLGAYTPVSYTNLDENQTYTIYVSYIKNGSKSENHDRGYVLIPNN
jgi:hypothetical protein